MNKTVKDTMVTDWILIDSEDHPFFKVVKEENENHTIASINQLESIANVLYKAGHKNSYKYLFNDRIFVKEGVFTWSLSQEKFNKLEDNYDEISYSVYDFINYDELLSTIYEVIVNVLYDYSNFEDIEMHHDFLYISIKDVNDKIDGMSIDTFLLDELYNRNIELEKLNLGFYFPEGDAISLQIHDFTRIHKSMIEALKN
ncbi:hypothetical protein [Halalkalibacter okhensis]|uniref:Uncharacterized protein n=1 Tax=Halalkalibacter okhensis TaxID=333138 RepID=A0A0B0IDQ6_9BACI|nr:hypothetical protein [Halalkalibacter okhensis]KHF40728.1 hypothetical protein LQ50_08045 [Halalkalibacter okhensis]